MKNILLILLLFVFVIKISGQSETDFYSKDISVFLNVDKDILKDVGSNTVLNIKLIANFSESELMEWIVNGENHYNVESIKIGNGNIIDGLDLVITFKNGLDYATGKGLFSGALLIDNFTMNGETMATNLFVSNYLPFRK